MSALKPSEVLSKAADLIEPEGAWIQEDMSRDARGEYAPPSAPEATCWCMMGAISRHADGYPIFQASREILKRVVGIQPESVGLMSSWNDNPDRTQAEVVAALRQAADLARSEGQ